MRNHKRQLGLPILMLSLFFAAQVQFTSEAVAQPASEAVLRVKPQVIVAFSPDIPPYVTHKATQGLQVDIVRDALSQDSLRVVQLPYKQLQTAIQEKQAARKLGGKISRKMIGHHTDQLPFLKN